MPRRKRSFVPGAPTHLTAHGVDDQPIFLSDLDRFSFLVLLRRITERVGWHVVAWCLMDTHYHVLVVAPANETRISWAMQTLNSVYARTFNQRHRRRGHVFGERFTDTLVASERHLQAAHDYVLQNPVAAGLVRTPQDWPWSGDHGLEPRPVPRQRILKVTASPAITASAITAATTPDVPAAATPMPSRSPATA